MNADLVQRLKASNLFPLEIDEEAQEQYRARGIDPSRLETHNSPTTPNYLIERSRRIKSNVLRLHAMESEGVVNQTEYRSTRDKIELDLDELVHPPIQDVLAGMFPEGPINGIGGVHRDIPSGNNGFYTLL